MKVLHVVPSYAPAWHLGGVVRAVTQLCAGLAQMGLDITVFTTDSGSNCRMRVPLNQRVDLNGVKVYYFKTNVSLKYAYSPGLRDACRNFLKSFDLVHLTSFWCYPAIPAISVARKYRTPYIMSIHGTLRNLAPKLNDLKRFIYYQAIEKSHIKGAAALHYTTEMERQLDSRYQFQIPSFIVPNGIDEQEFKQTISPSQAKESYGLSRNAWVIAFLGRLAYVKALDLLIKAISSPSLSQENLYLLIAGPDGGVENSLRKLVEKLGLQGKVRFLGTIAPEERNRLFAASDILSLVSENENFGYVAVEAMSAGVPVLVSDHVGICREVLADGAGMVVPLREEAISQALTDMLNNPAKLRDMGQAARQAVRHRYTLPMVAGKMLQAYQDILTGSRSPGLDWSDLKTGE